MKERKKEISPVVVLLGVLIVLLVIQAWAATVVSQALPHLLAQDTGGITTTVLPGMVGGC